MQAIQLSSPRNRNAHGLQLILRRTVKNRNLPPNIGACLPEGLPRNVFHNLGAHDLLRRHRCSPRLGTEGGSPGSARTSNFRARALHPPAAAGTGAEARCAVPARRPRGDPGCAIPRGSLWGLVQARGRAARAATAGAPEGVNSGRPQCLRAASWKALLALTLWGCVPGGCEGPDVRAGAGSGVAARREGGP